MARLGFCTALGASDYDELVERATDAAWKALKDGTSAYVSQEDGMIDASGEGIWLEPAVEAVLKVAYEHLAVAELIKQQDQP